MLCKYCRFLDFDAAFDERGAFHHESYGDLVASVESGCQLCSLIHNDPRNTAEQYGNDGRLRCSYNGVDSSLYWYLGDDDDPIAVTYICAADDNPMASVLCSRPIPLDARSDESFSRARAWIATCERDHKDCIQGSDHILPTRVVDIGDSVRQPSLLENNGRRGRWVALSYCWGKKPQLKTELSTLSTFRNGLPQNLPLLFQDAITTVKELGYQYLWIDALCIIQDSEQDWLTECADMGRIFKEAALVIIAEAAMDSSAGLFNSTNEGKDDTRITISSNSTRYDVHGELIISPPIEDVETSKGPLSKRAWPLQEEVLSSRNLRFASGQIWWQCWSVQRNESFPFGSRSKNIHVYEWGGERDFPLTSKPRRIRNMNKARQDAFYRPNQCWYWTVNNYCNRGITFEKDILPAISGIAKEYGKHLKQEYYAGLWSCDIHLGLLWCSPWPNATKTQTYIAPSWSWASLRLPPRLLLRLLPYEKRNVYHRQLVNYPPKHRVATIRSVCVTPLDQDTFGQVTAGILEITAPYHEICRCNIPPSFFDIHQLEDQDMSQIHDIFLEAPHFDENVDRNTLRKSCTTERIAEQKCCQSRDVVHKGCVLVHIASQESPRLALTLVLEAVTREEDGELQRMRVSNILEDLERPQTRSRTRALRNSGVAKSSTKDRNSRESGQESTPMDGRLQAYRRIGLVILNETTPTSAIWPTRTVTII